MQSTVESKDRYDKCECALSCPYEMPYQNVATICLSKQTTAAVWPEKICQTSIKDAQ